METLPTRPVSAQATEEQLLAREKELYEKIQEYKFNPAACPQEVVNEFQFLLRRRAKQAPPPPPIQQPRGEPVTRTGMENANPLNNSGRTSSPEFTEWKNGNGKRA
jgi:hypothetical protein